MVEKEIVCMCLACFSKWVADIDKSEQCNTCKSFYTVLVSGSDTTG